VDPHEKKLTARRTAVGFNIRNHIVGARVADLKRSPAQSLGQIERAWRVVKIDLQPMALENAFLPGNVNRRLYAALN
jgi:hypothetical protein